MDRIVFQTSIPFFSQLLQICPNLQCDLDPCLHQEVSSSRLSHTHYSRIIIGEEVDISSCQHYHIFHAKYELDGILDFDHSKLIDISVMSFMKL